MNNMKDKSNKDVLREFVPSGAMGGMMRVAGASDDDLEPDEEPITDDEDALRECIAELVTEIIRKVGDKWVLYAKHKKNGKRKRLGTHSSKASAERQERAIHSHH